MVIVVDTREKFIPRIKELIVDLPPNVECPEFEFRCLGLDLGDYYIENGGQSIGIERKSIGDFAANYGGLEDRLQKMRLHYDRTGLLIEGIYRISDDGHVLILEGSQLVPRMKYSTMTKFLIHEQERQTRMFHTLSFDETFYKLLEIHNYLPSMGTPNPAFKCGSAEEWISMLPGIGPKTIEKLKTQYASPLEVVNNLPKKAAELVGKW